MSNRSCSVFLGIDFVRFNLAKTSLFIEVVYQSQLNWYLIDRNMVRLRLEGETAEEVKMMADTIESVFPHTIDFSPVQQGRNP